MGKKIIVKKDGVSELRDMTNKELKTIGVPTNRKGMNKCWMCANGTPAKCSKIKANFGDLDIREIDYVTDAFQIINDDGLDDIIITGCNHYKKVEERKIDSAEKKRVKKIKNALKMAYFDTSSKEEADIKQDELIRRGELTGVSKLPPETIEYAKKRLGIDKKYDEEMKGRKQLSVDMINKFIDRMGLESSKHIPLPECDVIVDNFYGKGKCYIPESYELRNHLGGMIISDSEKARIFKEGLILINEDQIDADIEDSYNTMIHEVLHFNKYSKIGSVKDSKEEAYDETITDFMAMLAFSTYSNDDVNVLDIVKKVSKSKEDDSVSHLAKIMARHNDLELFKWVIDPLEYPDNFIDSYLRPEDMEDDEKVTLDEELDYLDKLIDRNVR